jgi:endonuclease-3
MTKSGDASIDKKISNRIIQKLRRHYGDVTPALEYKSIYQLTIAVVLSAQTTDRQVNQVTPDLFRKFPDFDSLSRAAIPAVETIIKSTGFYHAKARNIVALAKEAMNLFGGNLPADRALLMKLSGVGRKSANVILSQGFGIPALAVDTHVGRIARRLGYTTEDDPDKVEAALTGIIDHKNWTQSHLLFITHGRKICLARKPLCAQCPVSAECAFPDKLS